MHLQVDDNPDEQRYEIQAEGELAGYLAYHRRGRRIALNHTEILDGFEGKGIGSALVARTLDDLRERRLDVLPFCPFVRSFLGRHPEYVDVVPEDERARFGL
jgi:predicted GNAT family acetyltransferase